MDSTLLVKALAGGLGLACAMVLAVTGKIDGNQALGAVQTIVGVFIGSAAVLGGAQAVAAAMKVSSLSKGLVANPADTDTKRAMIDASKK